jgi:hypothetical protein
MVNSQEKTQTIHHPPSSISNSSAAHPRGEATRGTNSSSNRTGSPKQPTMPTAEEADHHQTMVDVEVNEDSSSSNANEGSSSKASNNSRNQDQEPEKIKADPTVVAGNGAP